MTRRLFNSKRRETIWLRGQYAAFKAGRGSLPICPHCDLPVRPTDMWDECHKLGREAAFGFSKSLDNVTPGHHLCNIVHGATVVRKAVEKSNRVRRKFIGAAGPGLGRHPMRGGRRDGFKIAIGGGIKQRLTNAEAHAAFMARRYGAFADQQQEPGS